MCEGFSEAWNRLRSTWICNIKRWGPFWTNVVLSCLSLRQPFWRSLSNNRLVSTIIKENVIYYQVAIFSTTASDSDAPTTPEPIPLVVTQRQTLSQTPRFLPILQIRSLSASWGIWCFVWRWPAFLPLRFLLKISRRAVCWTPRCPWTCCQSKAAAFALCDVRTPFRLSRGQWREIIRQLRCSPPCLEFCASFRPFSWRGRTLFLIRSAPSLRVAWKIRVVSACWTFPAFWVPLR